MSTPTEHFTVEYSLFITPHACDTKGAQRSNLNLDLTDTIQGNLELALRYFNCKNDSLTLSSRTDTGVHALNATAHVDILHGNRGYPHALDVRKHLNQFFQRSNTSIVVKEFKRVPNTFHARFSAICRTYLYRLAVQKAETCDDKTFIQFPIEEWRRCLLIRHDSFDVDLLRDALNLFKGTHDFESFKKKKVKTPWTQCIRTIQSVEVTPGHPMTTTYNSDITEYFDFWDITFKSRGFIHNQVRRMVGTGIGVALNRIDQSEIKVMLTVPSCMSWNNKIEVASPYGLYLCQVDYNEGVFEFKDQSSGDSTNVTNSDDSDEDVD